MNMQDKDQEFIHSVQSELDASVENISARDVSAITQLRHAALDRKADKRSRWMFVSAGAFASLFFAFVVFSFMQMTPDVQYQEQVANAEWENLATLPEIENFVVYGELDIDPDVDAQVEFYEWLDSYEPSGQG